VEKVEYKDTITIEFVTKRYNSVSEELENVVPTTYSAYLETAETSPEQLAEIDDITAIDTSTFWVNFYAHTDTAEEVTSGNAYYVAFYWEYGGVKKCERYGVVVVPNV
jgi:hypothetical protein